MGNISRATVNLPGATDLAVAQVQSSATDFAAYQGLVGAASAPEQGQQAQYLILIPNTNPEAGVLVMNTATPRPALRTAILQVSYAGGGPGIPGAVMSLDPSTENVVGLGGYTDLAVTVQEPGKGVGPDDVLEWVNGEAQFSPNLGQGTLKIEIAGQGEVDTGAGVLWSFTVWRKPSGGPSFLLESVLGTDIYSSVTTPDDVHHGSRYFDHGAGDHWQVRQARGAGGPVGKSEFSMADMHLIFTLDIRQI